MPVCPECNTKVAASQRTCPVCDTSLDGKKSSAKSKPATTKSSTAAAKKSTKPAKASDQSFFAVGGSVGVAVVIALFIGLRFGLRAYNKHQNRIQSQQTSGQTGAPSQPVVATNYGSSQETRDVIAKLGRRIPSYHDTHGSLPPPQYAPKTAPGLEASWMTHLLPYGDQAPIFNMYKFDKPWDGDDNLKTLQIRINEYRNPLIVYNYQDPKGREIAMYAANSMVITPTSSIKLAEMIDGTSNTMVMGTINQGFPAWGDPNNCRNPAEGFGGGSKAFGNATGQNAMILMFDGSVREVDPNMSKEVAAQLGNPKDGQIVTP